MKFINFKTFDDVDELGAAEVYLATQVELSERNVDKDEVYISMVNPYFSHGLDKNNQEVIGCRTICIYPQQSSEGKKQWWGMYMDGNEANVQKIGGLGRAIQFNGLFDIADDLNEIIKKANYCYGARNQEEIHQRMQEYSLNKQNSKIAEEEMQR